MDWNLPTSARDTGLIPRPGGIPRALEQLSLCATSTEAHGFRAHKPYSLCSTTREATAVRSSCTAVKSSPTHCSERKPTRSNEDPAQPKIKEKYMVSLISLKKFTLIDVT